MTRSASAATPSSVVAVRSRASAAVDPVVDRVGIELQPRGPPGEAVADAPATALDRGVVDVVQDDLAIGFERDLRDPGTHHA